MPSESAFRRALQRLDADAFDDLPASGPAAHRARAGSRRVIAVDGKPCAGPGTEVTSVAKGLAFPHAAQAIKVVRRRKVNGTWSRETCYAVTSLTVTRASHAQLAAIIRGHRSIEDRLHWVRDMDFGEDRSQARSAAGPVSWPACATS